MILFPLVVNRIIGEYCGWCTKTTMLEPSDTSPDGKLHFSVKYDWDQRGKLWEAELVNVETGECLWSDNGQGHINCPLWAADARYFIYNTRCSREGRQCFRVDIQNKWLDNLASHNT